METNRIERARRLTQQAQEVLQRRLQDEQELMVDQLCQQDPEYQAMQAQAAKLRVELHFLRVSISRKNYSIRLKEKAIAQVRQAKAAEQQKEANKVHLQQEVEGRIQRIRQQKAQEAEGNIKMVG